MLFILEHSFARSIHLWLLITLTYVCAKWKINFPSYIDDILMTLIGIYWKLKTWKFNNNVCSRLINFHLCEISFLFSNSYFCVFIRALVFYFVSTRFIFFSLYFLFIFVLFLYYYYFFLHFLHFYFISTLF